MQPLIFLTTRTVANGLKRALTSGRRLISLLFVILYWIFAIIRPYQRGSEFPSSFPSSMKLVMPPMHAIETVIFWIFAAICLFLSLGIFSYRGGFRPADLDVLFPTPVNPKVVLGFRIVRDTFLTLFLPLLFALFSWRPAAAGLQAFIQNFPALGGYVFKAMTFAWILVAMAWVSVGYSVSLFVNRSDEASDVNRKRLGSGLGIVMLGATGYFFWSLTREFSFDTVDRLAHAWPYELLFFYSTAATNIVMAPLTSNFIAGGLGFAFIMATIVVSMRVSMSQVGWMYDQAASKGFDALNMAQLQRKGDLYGVAAAQAAQGKIKRGKITSWVARKTPTGPAALIWKEVILQMRGSYMQYAVMVPVMITFFVVVALAKDDSSKLNSGLMFLCLNGVLIFLFAMMSQSGFIELLRRVDLQKPLPFSPATTIGWEIGAKTLPAVLLSTLASVIGTCVQPAIWQYAVANLIAAPFFAFVIVAVILFVTVLFPDVDDPSQRGFRNLMVMLGVLITALPGVAATIGLLIFKISPILAVLPLVVLNSIISVLLALGSGSFYASFNPNE